jgi:hypothetical protein
MAVCGGRIPCDGSFSLSYRIAGFGVRELSP